MIASSRQVGTGLQMHTSTTSNENTADDVELNLDEKPRGENFYSQYRFQERKRSEVANPVAVTYFSNKAASVSNTNSRNPLGIIDLKNIAKEREKERDKEDRTQATVEPTASPKTIEKQDLENFSTVLNFEMQKIKRVMSSGSLHQPGSGETSPNQQLQEIKEQDSVSDEEQSLNSDGREQSKPSPKGDLSYSKGIAISPEKKQYQAHKSTKRLISQAVQVLDSEKAYNNANLDQYLMGIKKVNIEKKNLPKKLPSIQELRNIQNAEKLNHLDESFHIKYAALSQKKQRMQQSDHHRHKTNEDLVLQSEFQQLHNESQLKMIEQLRRSPSSSSIIKQTNREQRSEKREIQLKNLRQESNRTLILDYGMKEQPAEADLYIYPSQQEKSSSQALVELMNKTKVQKNDNYAIKENHMDSNGNYEHLDTAKHTLLNSDLNQDFEYHREDSFLPKRQSTLKAKLNAYKRDSQKQVLQFDHFGQIPPGMENTETTMTQYNNKTIQLKEHKFGECPPDMAEQTVSKFSAQIKKGSMYNSETQLQRANPSISIYGDKIDAELQNGRLRKHHLSKISDIHSDGERQSSVDTRQINETLDHERVSNLEDGASGAEEHFRDIQDSPDDKRRGLQKNKIDQWDEEFQENVHIHVGDRYLDREKREEKKLAAQALINDAWDKQDTDGDLDKYLSNNMHRS